MDGRVNVGAGVAAQVQRCDSELRLPLVPLVRPVVVEHYLGSRLGKARIGLHSLHDGMPQLDDQARRAVTAGRDDLARVAIERKWLALNEVEGLNKQIAEVEADKQRLAGQERTLQIRVEQFRTHREVVSARYTAAEAEVRLKESLAGVSGELAELSMAVGRAEEKADRLQARARAIDSLVDLGSFPPIGGGDFVEAELLHITISKEIDDELARIKSEVEQASSTKESKT